jgi:hypothetical protein
MMVGFVQVQLFKREAFMENVVAFPLITPAAVLFLTNVNPEQSVRVFVCAPAVAIVVISQVQSVKVPPAKHSVIVKGDTNKAVVGLFPTPTFVMVIAVATSDNKMPSIKPLFVTLTE